MREIPICKTSNSVADIDADHHHRKSTIRLKYRPEDERKVSAVYRLAHRIQYPRKYLPPFTMKELGQLGQIEKYLGSEESHRVVYDTVRNWPCFLKAVSREESAQKNMPRTPHVGFLLKWVEVARCL